MSDSTLSQSDSNASSKESDYGNGLLRLTYPRLIFLGIALLTVVLLVFVKPAIPDRISLLTGPEGSAYHDLGVFYAEDLRDRGLEVEVVVTDGPFDNVRMVLEEDDVIALAPSAVDWETELGVDVSALTALGSVAFEPLWLFHRSDSPISRLSDLAGQTVFTEGEGTASHYVAKVLFEKNELEQQVELKPFGPERTAEELIQALTNGDIDAVFLTGHPSSSRLKTLLHADGLHFMSFERAEAYAAQIPGITSLRLPQGMVDLARNVPEADSQLLSKTTCLIAHENLHPSVVLMLLVTADDVRSTELAFPDSALFPNREHLSLPIHPAARRFFQQGEVGLSKYLPYGVTRFINHIGFFVLPAITLLLVVLKAVPTTVKVWSNLRLKQRFKQLESIEKRCAAGEESTKLLAELDQISQESASMYIPLSISPDYIDFRQFVHDMRDRIKANS